LFSDKLTEHFITDYLKMHFTTFSLYLMSVLVGLSKTSLDHNQFTEKANLCPYIYIVYPHHTEVSLPRQWSERSCICVL